jgi:hypothetical protein
MTDDWRPMSTAPRDGAYIILAYPAGTNLRIRIGRWLPGYDGHPGYWYAYSGAIRRRNEQPTHWTPLPQPPSKPHDPAPADPPDPPPRKAGAIALPIPPEEPAA